MNLREFQFMRESDVAPAIAGQEVVTVRPSTGGSLVAYLVSSLIFWVLAGAAVIIYLDQPLPLLPQAVPGELLGMYEALREVDDGFLVLVGFLGFFVLVFKLATFAAYRRSKLVRSWLAIMTAKGIFIQFRSYLNQHMNVNDETVMFIPAVQIGWLREARITVAEKESNGTTYSLMRTVEVQTKGLDYEGIERHLEDELAGRNSRKSRFGDERVMLANDGVVRIKWSNMRPKPDMFIERAKRWYMTQAPVKVREERLRTYSRPFKKPDPALMERAQVETLAAMRSGRKIEAIRIVRDAHGFSLKMAKDYVESLDLSGGSE